jgi:hypothetical protein
MKKKGDIIHLPNAQKSSILILPIWDSLCIKDLWLGAVNII